MILCLIYLTLVKREVKAAEPCPSLNLESRNPSHRLEGDCSTGLKESARGSRLAWSAVGV